MDGNGWKLEKIGQFFRVLLLHVQNFLKKFIMITLSDKIHFRSSSYIALQKHFAYDLSSKEMILAQN